MSVLQVLEPSRVLSVIHTFDCHTGEVTAVSKSFLIVRPFFTLSYNSPPSSSEEALHDDAQNCGVADNVVSYVAVSFTSCTAPHHTAWQQKQLLRGLHSACVQALKGEMGRRGNWALFTPFQERQNSPLPLFPFEACHTGQVIKSGEMRGYRSLPHVNIARSTGSRTKNCSNKNPAGKIKILLSRNNSHIQSLHRRLMLACADSIEHRASTGTCAQGWETLRILKCEI